MNRRSFEWEDKKTFDGTAWHHSFSGAKSPFIARNSFPSHFPVQNPESVRCLTSFGRLIAGQKRPIFKFNEVISKRKTFQRQLSLSTLFAMQANLNLKTAYQMTWSNFFFQVVTSFGEILAFAKKRKKLSIRLKPGPFERLVR